MNTKDVPVCVSVTGTGLKVKNGAPRCTNWLAV